MEERQNSHPDILQAGPRRTSTSTSNESSHPHILRAGGPSQQFVQSPINEDTPDVPTPDMSTPGSGIVEQKSYFPPTKQGRTTSSGGQSRSISSAFSPRRGSSVDQVSPMEEGVPSALKISSPRSMGEGSGRDSSPSTTAGNARVSQLFNKRSSTFSGGAVSPPSRPVSIVSPITDDGRRHSLPHPASLLPAEARAPIYTAPDAPPPPSLDADTSYDSGYLRSPQFGSAGAPSRSISIYKKALGKLGTLRGPTRHGRPYDTLHEVDEDDYGGHDMTSLTGPIGLRDMSTTAAESRARQDVVDLHGYAAEFHQLEADGKLTGGLGGGMQVKQLEFNSSAVNPVGQGSDGAKSLGGGLMRGTTIREVGQREAKERGEMVAVSEGLGVDITSLTTGGEDTIVPRDADAASLKFKTSDKQSYYFPPDHNMPNWKPFPMHWSYISLVVIVSFLLAGVQEYGYQVSNKLQNQNPKDGILKFKELKEVSTLKFFAWKYLPIMIAVLYGIMWQIVDFEVKRLEPFYQLSRQTGATAAESLNIDYLTFWTWLAPVKALKYKQWAVFCSSLAALLASSIVPTLQSASVTLHPQSKNGKPVDPSITKYVVVISAWSRLLTVTLCITGILGACLLWQLQRKSGLLSDPKGIAGIAAMANKSHILQDFKGLDTAKPEKIHSVLRHRRYILHKSTIWQGEYIKRSEQATETRKSSDNSHPLMLESIRKSSNNNPHPLMLQSIACVPFIFSMVVFFGLLPVILFTNANVIAEKASWILTLIASSIKIIWSVIDCDIRMLEPFYILSRRHAPPSALTLDYTGTIWGWLPIKAARNGHYLTAMVAFCAVLTEILTVCVSSFGVKGTSFLPGFARPKAPPGGNSPSDTSYTGEETFKSFWTTFILSMSILLCLMTTAGLVLRRRRHPFLPRDPSTIASVLAFIHQSKMLWDFVDTEQMDEAAMDEHLKTFGKRYGLGWFRGRDGEEHCGVDEEELLSNYRHGEAFADAVRPWNANWDVY